MPHNWLDQISIHLTDDTKAAWAVVMGTLIRSLYKKDIKLKIALLNMITMVIIMRYLGPALVEKYHLGPSGVMGIGIVCGMFGADIIRGLFKIGDVFANDPTSLISIFRWFKK